MSPSYVAQWLHAFIATAVVETLCVAAIVRRFCWLPQSIGVIAYTTLLAQLLSHPAVWFVFPALGLPRWHYLIFVESWAVLVEGTFYYIALRPISWRCSLGLSLFANGASWGLGSLLRRLGAPI